MQGRVLNDEMLLDAMKRHWIENADEKNIQPASLDLTLSSRIWVRDYQSLTVDFKRMTALKMLGTVLEKGKTYVVELNESLNLPKHLVGYFSTKSSLGRLGLLIKVINEQGRVLDQVPYGYRGKLYAEITSLSFDVKIYKGLPVTQIRLIVRDLFRPELTPDKTVLCSSNTAHYYISNEKAPILDLSTREHHSKYFIERHGSSDTNIVIAKNTLCLIASNENIEVDSDYCAEVVPYNTSMGEFRSHFAGFIDPGFVKSKIVLEVMPVLGNIELISNTYTFQINYYKMESPPSKPYGERDNHYLHQDLKLSRFLL